MRRKHLVLGFAVVLAISIAVPALGESLPLYSGSSSQSKKLAKLTAMVKRARKAVKAAQTAAQAAQGTADSSQLAAQNAQSTAKAAQSAATAAQTVATGAGNTAAGAQGVAAAAKSVADSAQGATEKMKLRVDASADQADQALTVANSAVTAVAEKFGDVEEVKVLAPPPSSTSSEAEATAPCPGGSKVIGGGFLIFDGAAEPHLSLPIENGWFVAAQSDHNNFKLEVIAMCLRPEKKKP